MNHYATAVDNNLDDAVCEHVHHDCHRASGEHR